jgi:hypothetical protein
MHADLKALEEKLSHLISLCVKLRTENTELKSELTAIKQDTAQLKTNMAVASDRIEALMESLP